MSPTEEQLAIVAAAASKKESLMLPAFAGTGKTSTLKLLAPKIREPAMALAFNKSIAETLKGALPSNYTVKTFNGIGFLAWMKANPQVVKWEVDGKKLGKLVSQTCKDLKIDLSEQQWKDCRQLVTGVQLAGLLPTDSEAAWNEVAEYWMLDDFPILYEVGKETLHQSTLLAKQGKISFDDQVYCPTVLGGQWPKFPRLLVDEAQDLNQLNHRMLELCSRPDGRWVTVGDPLQSIYGFRGSVFESMAQIKSLRSSWLDLPLTLSFRCPKLIVERQQNHAKGFRAASGNLPGQLMEFSTGWSWETIASRVDGHSLAVLCRNNAPLLSFAFKLIRQGVGPMMLGRELGANLVNLSKKLAKDDSLAIPVFKEIVEAWRASEASKATANEEDEKLAAVHDRADCFLAVIESGAPNTVGELRNLLVNLFDRQSGKVTLSTIHKAKGLEWDSVLHLDPWRLPSKRARQKASEGDGRELQQELNLLYVAETRTKNQLLLASLNQLGETSYD